MVIIFILGIIYYFSFDYANTLSQKNIINQQIENSKIQANIVSSLLEERLKNGFSKEQVKNELQNSIENMSIENSFVCMFDSTGREICHPIRQKIGKVLTKNNSIIKSLENDKVEMNFKEAVMKMQSKGGIRKLKNYSEIVYLSPVKHTGWIVASHANLTKFQKEFNHQEEMNMLIFVLVWLSSSLLIFLFLFHMNAINLKKVSNINRNISSQYFKELKAINDKLSQTGKNGSNEIKRLLADKGAKLKPVLIENIAYIYTQNKITYIVEFDGTKSTINTSLDDLSKLLDKKIFYRASRQVIISIKAIDKIEKRGKTQLKVITNPPSPVEIIISKAKLMEFKKWAGRN